jgi:hypothetical protein
VSQQRIRWDFFSELSITATATPGILIHATGRTLANGMCFRDERLLMGHRFELHDFTREAATINLVNISARNERKKEV